MLRISTLILSAGLFAAATSASAEEALLDTGSASGAGPHLDIDTHIPMGPILLTSFSAVAIAVGAGFGWEAHQDYEDWKDARDTGDASGAMDDLADDVKTHSIAADVLMFGGAAGAIIGVIWWIQAAKHEKTEKPRRDTVSFHPLFGPAQAGAAVEF